MRQILPCLDQQNLQDQRRAMGVRTPVLLNQVNFLVGFSDMQRREVDEVEYGDLWAGITSPQQPNRRGSF
ncbi:hypothetical protein Pla144_06080 [Bythopirellula polymerisocia]|uniref:Uncharacterized protein n=1 Tax=Bythopirellula polymerisocia TaxID=2528003 RepID=A0A5C6D4N6_9BACT|nr:hypothetical protein Pla144_06080 [Bythopirellula polymerisocia]